MRLAIRSTLHDRLPLFIAGGLLLMHVGLLAWQANGDSPTWDEIGHFVAGVCTWRTGTFNMYRVNPPLVRLVATLPESLRQSQVDVAALDSLDADNPTNRPEFEAGAYYAAVTGPSYFARISEARWLCIPFSLLGGIICFFWARDLWGRTGGLVALALWTVSPTVLAYGHLIVPDVALTSIALLSLYSFRRWLRLGGWANAICCGIFLGFAQLTKMTLVIYLALFPILWVSFELCCRKGPGLRRRLLSLQMVQILTIDACALIVLNAGYGFAGSFTPLRNFNFASAMFAGPHPAGVDVTTVGNRFRSSWLGRVPVPVPADYLKGMDLQRLDFERRQWSYLNGMWKLGGWWYYYLFALAIKEPLGYWFLGTVAFFLSFRAGGCYRQALWEELLLLVPAVAILGFVSSQTGFNHHVRYVLPALPLFFILFARVGRAYDLRHRQIAAVASCLLAWGIFSSLRYQPHSLSYFNEIAGGPKAGYRFLANSNADWGQDLLYLRKWYDSHPDARPLYLRCDLTLIDPSLAGIDWLPIPTVAGAEEAAGLKIGPGWYVVSVNQLNARSHGYDYFNHLKPVDWVGYTLPIYHVTPGQAAELNHEFFERSRNRPPSHN